MISVTGYHFSFPHSSSLFFLSLLLLFELLPLHIAVVVIVAAAGVVIAVVAAVRSEGEEVSQPVHCFRTVDPRKANEDRCHIKHNLRSGNVAVLGKRKSNTE